ncbi:hypothetical protein CJ030_MR6G021600 [Morella rubra]|uniref:non-specific serine/threonine protein kinase n=1 Tax=Morella rubra TaxID=262757 RepID=A0A6A1VJH0_9ROSI|nr:hypothetical protein CJ030_MR6G021600 [Morella rubra]
MESRLHLPTITLSFMIIAISLIHFPSGLYAIENEKYLNCSETFECGDIKGLSYPFWGSTRPSYCGHPDFQLNCSGGVAQMNISFLKFRVLSISAASSSLTVARADYWNELCPATLVNTTINSTIFSYSSTATNLTLYYGCPAPSSGVNISTTGTFQLFCDINSTITAAAGYYNSMISSNPTFSNFLGSCQYNVKVPVAQSAVPAATGNVTEAALIKAIDGGFTLEWNANNTLCNSCQNSNGQCGTDESTSSFVCYGSAAEGTRATLSLRVRIGLIGAFLVGVVGTTVVIYYRKRAVRWSREAMTDDFRAEEIIKKYGSTAPKRYSYSDLKKLTNSFKHKIGKGGFGVVYKGKLHDGRIVAVKVLNSSKGKGDEFVNEVASISGTSHVNVVTLLGFCYERTKRALIYEFMPNGSLDKFIYGEKSSIESRRLDDKTLFQIAVGIARGLEYLHRGCRTRILHFDIKPHNILLDEDLCPKISDFGLSKLCKTKQSIVSMMGMRGTVGYIAPEVFSRNFGGVSHKSDVYSYGMLVLEMVGGKKEFVEGASNSSEIYFPDSVYRKLEQGENFETSSEIGERGRRDNKKDDNRGFVVHSNSSFGSAINE